MRDLAASQATVFDVFEASASSSEGILERWFLSNFVRVSNLARIAHGLHGRLGAQLASALIAVGLTPMRVFSAWDCVHRIRDPEQLRERLLASAGVDAAPHLGPKTTPPTSEAASP